MSNIIVICCIFEVIDTIAYFVQRPAHELAVALNCKAYERILVPFWVKLVSWMGFLFSAFYIYLCFTGHIVAGIILLTNGMLSAAFIKTPSIYYQQTLQRLYTLKNDPPDYFDHETYMYVTTAVDFIEKQFES